MRPGYVITNIGEARDSEYGAMELLDQEIRARMELEETESYGKSARMDLVQALELDAGYGST